MRKVPSVAGSTRGHRLALDNAVAEHCRPNLRRMVIETQDPVGPGRAVGVEHGGAAPSPPEWSGAGRGSLLENPTERLRGRDS